MGYNLLWGWLFDSRSSPWGTRRPSGAARTLIEVIKREPKAVKRALKKELAS